MLAKWRDRKFYTTLFPAFAPNNSSPAAIKSTKFIELCEAINTIDRVVRPLGNNPWWLLPFKIRAAFEQRAVIVFHRYDLSPNVARALWEIFAARDEHRESHSQHCILHRRKGKFGQKKEAFNIFERLQDVGETRSARYVTTATTKTKKESNVRRRRMPVGFEKLNAKWKYTTKKKERKVKKMFEGNAWNGRTRSIAIGKQ